MSKSGEILRISHGNYSFLCSHCGFNFNDINEILVHIDFHFDISDSKITTPADTTDISHATGSLLCDDTDGDCTNYSVQKLCIEQIFNSENVRTEFKIEYDREGKTDELPLDDEVLEKTERLDVPSKINRHKTSGTKRRNVTKKLNTTNDDNQDNDSRSYPIGESDSNGSSDWKPHLGDPHQMLDKTFECYICGYFCKTFAALKRHLGGSVHSKSNCYQCESQPVVHNELHPRPHKCCLCGTWFENHLHFRKHFKNSHGKDVEKFFAKRSNCNEYSCYICKKDFLHKYYLKSHMIIHNELKAFICDVCGKTYRTKAILKRHLNVHEGKIYECDQCDKTFPYYARLRIHRYSHRTELNYICQVCSKAFKVQKYLARHMKVHKEEKAYPCKYCGKRFTFSTGRRAHEISQHNAI